MQRVKQTLKLPEDFHPEFLQSFITWINTFNVLLHMQIESMNESQYTCE